MLLDDVMSELDPERRERLVRDARGGGGQALITATEAAHVPAGGDGARAGDRATAPSSATSRRGGGGR